MKALSKDDAKLMTNANMRDAIKGMIKTSNRINFESGDSELNKTNLWYFLVDDYTGLTGTRVDQRFKLDSNGGIKPIGGLSNKNKEELRQLYNDLVGYINSDVDSTLYEERQKIGTQKFLKFVNDDIMQNPNGTLITEEDANAMFELRTQCLNYLMIHLYFMKK